MKIAVVTGASTGIGRAVSVALSKVEYEVFLLGRNVDGLGKTKVNIEETGGKAHCIQVDLADIASIHSCIDDLKKKTSQINLLANIAGIWHGAYEVFADTPFENFDQSVILDTFAVGTIAPALLVHGLLPLMKAKSKIINLSGTFENGAKGWLPYFVSKRAIEDLTIGLSQELAEKDIQVNGVSPSDTATEAYAKYFPQFMEEAISPEEIANQFVVLSQDDQTSGKIFVMKKGQEPKALFHY